MILAAKRDVAGFKFSDVRDGLLFITQEKTGYKLAIPLDLKLEILGLVLNDVIERCRINNPCDL